jgi:hypothetical protein
VRGFLSVVLGLSLSQIHSRRIIETWEKEGNYGRNYCWLDSSSDLPRAWEIKTNLHRGVLDVLVM